MSAQAISKKQIQYLQSVRRKAGVSDEDYRAMKASVGVTSTKNLTKPLMDDLLRRLGELPPIGGRKKTASWKPVHKSAARSGMDKRPAADREHLVRKIEAILTELGLPWSYADGIAKRVCKVELLRFCDAEQTLKVLQALAVYQRRKTGSSKRPTQERS